MKQKLTRLARAVRAGGRYLLNPKHHAKEAYCDGPGNTGRYGDKAPCHCAVGAVGRYYGSGPQKPPYWRTVQDEVLLAVAKCCKLQNYSLDHCSSDVYDVWDDAKLRGRLSIAKRMSKFEEYETL